MTRSNTGLRGMASVMTLAVALAACAPAATPAPSPSPPGSPGSPAPGSPAPSPAAEPVAVCELAYYTGEFAPYGPALTADVVFPIKEVINLDPPLGRTWETYHEDLGTVGEAQAARTCLEQRKAEIIVSIAHGYRTYRDFMIEWWKEHDSPLGPSVHGGAIPGNLGGKPAEPIFRAQGLDDALGVTGSLYAESIGAKNIVIFATQVEGFQLAANAAEKSAKLLGLTVLARIDAPAEQPSYRAEAQRIAGLKPDAVIVQAGSVESATLIKQAAEAGLSLYWIGETGWSQAEFIGTLGTAPIATQKGIGYAAFSHRPGPSTSRSGMARLSTTRPTAPTTRTPSRPTTSSFTRPSPSSTGVRTRRAIGPPQCSPSAIHRERCATRTPSASPSSDRARTSTTRASRVLARTRRVA